MFLVQCSAPINGMLQCPNGTTSTYGDTCSFSCNPGYELQGAQTGSCLANQIWSRGFPTCVPLNCPEGISIYTNAFVQFQECTLTYLSQCELSCPGGYIGDDVTYLCNVTSDLSVVDWVPIDGVNMSCERG